MGDRIDTSILLREETDRWDYALGCFVPVAITITLLSTIFTFLVLELAK